DEETDPRARRQLERERDRTHGELADPAERQHDEHNAREEDRAQRRLPRDAHAQDDRIREVRIQSHARREREGVVREQTHRDRAEGGRDRRREERARDRDARLREDERVHDQDVRHRQEGREPRFDLRPDRRPMLAQTEEPLEQTSRADRVLRTRTAVRPGPSFLHAPQPIVVRFRALAPCPQQDTLPPARPLRARRSAPFARNPRAHGVGLEAPRPGSPAATACRGPQVAGARRGFARGYRGPASQTGGAHERRARASQTGDANLRRAHASRPGDGGVAMTLLRRIVLWTIVAGVGAVSGLARAPRAEAQLVRAPARSVVDPRAAKPQGDLEAQRTGEALYRDACAACHGPDGRGMPAERVGFDTPLPDFTDCSFATREPDADWFAVVHEGGPVRAFARIMPAYGDALTDDEIAATLAYIRTLCTDDRWPRGELNLPRALRTEKAYPEDEAVFTTHVALEGPRSVLNEPA